MHKKSVFLSFPIKKKKKPQPNRISPHTISPKKYSHHNNRPPKSKSASSNTQVEISSKLSLGKCKLFKNPRLTANTNLFSTKI